MADKRELLGLAERCEKAGRCDFNLDQDIDQLIKQGYLPPEGEREPRPFASRYTGSLDAAMTLVPEGWHWSVSYLGWRARADVYSPGHDWSAPPPHGETATPALALTAASLRAIASEVDHG